MVDSIVRTLRKLPLSETQHMKKNRLLLSFLLAGASFNTVLQAQQPFAAGTPRSSVGRIGDDPQRIGDSELGVPVSLAPDARPDAFKSNAVIPNSRYIGHTANDDGLPSVAEHYVEPQYADQSQVAPASYSPAVSFASAPLSYTRTLWAEADALLWFAGGRNAPPLVTSHPTAVIPPTLDNPGTTILAGGNQPIGTGVLPGYRVGVGMWLDDSQSVGIGGRGFGLFGGNVNRTFASTGVPSVGVPFFNTSLGDNFVYLVGFNDGASSNVGSVTTSSRLGLTAAEGYGRFLVAKSGSNRVDLIGGYMFASLSDRLDLNTRITDGIANAIQNGTVITTSDRFSTANTFHGGQFGLMSEWTRGKWTLENSSTFALGNMNQSINNTGRYTETPPGGATISANRGLLVQSSNAGTASRNTFAFIPQFDTKLGYHINSNVRFDVGYSFLFFSNVATAGNQIDTNIDVANILATPIAPQRRLVSDSMFLHGVNLGLTFKF
jgi:Putative beta barrel porin-7 (BBP7)